MITSSAVKGVEKQGRCGGAQIGSRELCVFFKMEKKKREREPEPVCMLMSMIQEERGKHAIGVRGPRHRDPGLSRSTSCL